MPKLSPNAAQALQESMEQAKGLFDPVFGETADLIADIYTGRDPNSGSIVTYLNQTGDIPINHIEATKTVGQRWSPPETTANLFLSRVRTLVSSLVAAKPTFMVKARNHGAVRMAEHQNAITEWQTDHGGLVEAMDRAAFIGLISPFFAIKMVPCKEEKEDYKKVKFETLNPTQCGYEPHYRRYLWHTYDKPWGELPKSWRPKGVKDKQDWDMVRVTEVYHPGGWDPERGKPGVPLSIWVNCDANSAPEESKRDTAGFGNYVVTERTRECPIVIEAFLEPALGEDIPPPEALSWLPVLRMIVQLLVQIDKEIKTTNKVVLFDKNKISGESIQEIITGNPGANIYIGVDSDDTDNGVNATMRPVERDDVLGNYLATLQQYMALLDDVIGIGPQERGIPAQPRKSATEAQAITAVSSRQNRQRLKIISRAFSKLARVAHAYQRELYGKTLEIPVTVGQRLLTKRLPVPDPREAAYTFDVDPIELEALSRRGEIDSLTFITQLIGQQMANFGGRMPALVREMVRRLAKLSGVSDADVLLNVPSLDTSPEERLIEHAMSGEPLPVLDSDQHAMFFAYYDQLLQKVVSNPVLAQGAMDIGEIQIARDKHQLALQRQEQRQLGMAAQGTVGAQVTDNAAAPSLAAGAAPGLMRNA